MKSEDDQPVDSSFFTLDEALKFVKQTKDEIPFPKAQSKRFTVHASADPSKNIVCTPSEHFFSSLVSGNPYNEVIDYEDMDALNQGLEGTSVSKKEGSKSKSKKSGSDKPQQPTNQSNKRPALVVQQLPPPMLLPP